MLTSGRSTLSFLSHQQRSTLNLFSCSSSTTINYALTHGGFLHCSGQHTSLMSAFFSSTSIHFTSSKKSSQTENISAQEKNEEKEDPYDGIGYGAWKQDQTRVEPTDPILNPKAKEPGFNRYVDEWVDSNNPRWRALKKTFHQPGPLWIGKCVAIRNKKTARIEVPHWYRKFKYSKNKAVKHTTVFLAHDENEICEAGDIVEIRHAEKRSPRKYTVVTRIVKKDVGNAFLKEHPEYRFTRSKVDLRKRAEVLRKEEQSKFGLKFDHSKKTPMPEPSSL